MNYLLTGATGFIGTALVERLLSEGHSVNYLGRSRSKRLDSRAAFHHWDGLAAPPLDTVGKVDAIVNLAGEPISQRWTKEVKQRIYSSRVEGTRKLVRALGTMKNRPSVLVSASAVGFYGDRGDELLTEDSRAGSGFLAEACVDWEKEALQARQFDVRVVLVRISIVLGKDGGALKPMLAPFKLGLGGQFGDGRQWMPWIHRDDLVRLFIHAAQTDSAEGPLNASVPSPVTNAQFTAAMGQALHRPTLIAAPRFALRLVLGELATSILASQRVVPARTEGSGFHFQHPDLESTLVELTAG